MKKIFSNEILYLKMTEWRYVSPSSIPRVEETQEEDIPESWEEEVRLDWETFVEKPSTPETTPAKQLPIYRSPVEPLPRPQEELKETPRLKKSTFNPRSFTFFKNTHKLSESMWLEDVINLYNRAFPRDIGVRGLLDISFPYNTFSISKGTKIDSSKLVNEVRRTGAELSEYHGAVYVQHYGRDYVAPSDPKAPFAFY